MRYNKNQLNAYRGVLKNKNLAKVMEEGLTAPVGSTKRKRAQKMLSILKKTTIDGQGGPGPRSVPRVNVQLRPSTVDYSNLLILPPAPKIRVQFGENAPTPKPVHDGQGYPGPMDGKGFMGFGGSTAPTAGSMTLNLAKSAPKAGGLVVPPYSAGLSTRLLGGLGAARAAGSALTGPIGMGITAASVGIPAVGKNIVWGMQDRLVNHEADPMFRTSNSTVPYQEVLPKGQTATGNRAAAAAAAAAPKPIMWGDKTLGAESTPTNTVNGKSLKDLSIEWAGGVPGMQNFVDSSTPETMGSTPEPTMGGRFPGVQDAVNQNLGPSMFAYNSLKEDGGGLYERLMKIEETTRKSYNLDQMRDQLNSMVMSGNTLEGRLTDYIRGRDEFLNETEDVISDLKSKSMKMDMSDPRTRGNMQQHFNYLYELRGRQNKRYVEFLDMSVNAYQGKIDAAKQVYDTEFSRYENEVLNKQNIAKEEYNMLFTGLQEMYNTVAGAETAALEKQMMEYQVAAARAASIKDVIALEGVNSGDVLELDKALKTMNVIDANGAWVPTNNALNLSGVNIYQLPDRMDQAVARAMFKYDEKGNAIGPADTDQALYVAQNALGVLMQLQAAGIVVGDEYYKREESIRNHLARTIEQSDTFLPTDSLPSYRKAIEALAGDGWIFNRKTPTREDFIRKYGPSGEKLDTGILNTIYSNLEGYLQDGQTARSFVDTYFTDMGELAQPGEPIDSDSLMRRKMLQDYMQRLQPAKIAGTLSFSKVGGDTNPASLQKAAQAIANIESSGGNYRAVGPVTASGDQAYGKYQVMGANIPSWTKAALGVAMTPQQFLANPNAQEAVFAHIFGGYVKQYGTYEDAASAWFSGRPMARAGNASDVLGTSVPQYVARFQQSFYS